MKKINHCILWTICFFSFQTAKSQQYELTFASAFTPFTVDSVFIENLAQGTSLTIAGSDILFLDGTVGIDSQKSYETNINVYPNPSDGTIQLTFTSSKDGVTECALTDISGREIVKDRQPTERGQYTYILQDVPSGNYILNIKTSGKTYSKLIHSTGNPSGHTSISLNLQKCISDTKQIPFKNSKDLVVMEYHDGEVLVLTGYSGNLKSVTTLIPESSEEISFSFYECIDAAGNHYATIKVEGRSQVWMAENLRYLPFVSGYENGSTTSPYYYVYGYDGTNIGEAMFTPNYYTYGVLYNWPAAMISCPYGWHLPNSSEWAEYSYYLQSHGYTYNGIDEGIPTVSKAMGAVHNWAYSDAEGAVGNTDYPFSRNKSGFNALPGGDRKNIAFSNLNYYACWWTSESVEGTETATYYYLYWSSNALHLSYYIPADRGFSVRCVRN